MLLLLLLLMLMLLLLLLLMLMLTAAAICCHLIDATRTAQRTTAATIVLFSRVTVCRHGMSVPVSRASAFGTANGWHSETANQRLRPPITYGTAANG